MSWILISSMSLPNAAPQPRPEARAERRLKGVGCRRWFGAGVIVPRGLPATASGALPQWLCLHPLHHPQYFGRRVPRLPVRPPCPFQQSGIFRQSPFPSGGHDDHENIEELGIEEIGNGGRVWAGDDALDDPHPAMPGSGSVHGGENLDTLCVTTAMQDAFHHISVC